MNLEKIAPFNNETSASSEQEEIKLYFYRVIHDIKAPIASMMGLIRISKMKMKDKKSQDFFTEIEKYFRLLETEISSSLKGGVFFNENTTTDAIDFEETLSEVIELLMYSRDINTIRFHKTIKQERYFNINKQLIFSILQNIIDNSIKHGRDSDSQELNITIQIKQQNKAVKIIIKDDGKGICENTRKKLFENFHSANDLLLKGNGLGLYIIKKTVDKLNGNLAIESNQGRGTKFSISIPEAL